jgi:ADP-ribosylglycohydrolase
MIQYLRTLLLLICYSGSFAYGQSGVIKIKKEELQDKIRGGWAGQTIGVTFGGPYEFRYEGTFIQDYKSLLWNDTLIKSNMLNNPGLYDDLYMDLTFVDVFEKYGLDAPVDSFANAFAHAGYMLWHANQAGRYNILNGIKAPASGYWLNNPHADCIDYQIESDYAGLMSPGMPNTASGISDKIGHIMNYGDGWYGGVFVGAMYTLAFTSNNIPHIINEALKTIPAQSDFYRCITDVIGWQKEFPSDWKQCWLEIQKKWANDIGCPDGVFNPFDIDAKVNAAYVVMGLLYGKGDFTNSLEIAIRCGQDADCNPSTVGGILGALFGYDKIPSFWKMGLKVAEGIPFKYTTMSLNDVYDISFKQALENIRKNGGKTEGDLITIEAQKPVTVRFEKSFEGHFPIDRIPVSVNSDKNEINFEFDGIGFVLTGEISNEKKIEYVFNTELYIDGKLAGSYKLPADFTTRRTELCWKYQLLKGRHTVRIKILNPANDISVSPYDAIIYSDKLLDGTQTNKIKAAEMK